MTRREFSTAVKVAVVKRATLNGLVYCEGCGLPTRDFRVDHKRADGLLGDPTIENAQLLGKCCYAAKDAADTTAIAKAKRREASHLGVKPARAFQIRSRGFRKFARPSNAGAERIDKAALPPLPRRNPATRSPVR